jgi:hypothetical protein
MTTAKFAPVEQSQQEAMQDDVETALMELIRDKCDLYQFSPISTAALTLHALVFLMRDMGGPQTQHYASAVAEGCFSKDKKVVDRTNKRMMRSMEKMAEHFDLLMAETGAIQ